MTVSAKGYVRYAYRLETRRVREPDFPYKAQKPFDCAAAAIQFALSMDDLDIEKFLVLYLDIKNKLIGIHMVPGTVGCAAVHVREVFKHALLCGASSIVLAHNHPSGNREPSGEDIRLTNVVRDAAKLFGIRLLDHVIIGEGKGVSFREEGLLT